MEHFTVKYDDERLKLTIFHNGKVLGGMIGPIAKERYYAIKQEMKRIDVLKQISDGHKTKKTKV